jgi:ADP-heptose:LPS heptosyltransferase
VAVSERPLLLVLRAFGLGDLLTGVPALRALRDAHPEHRLVLATPAPLAELALLTGAVDEVAPARPLAPLPPRLHGADLAVNLHGRGPESHRVLLASRPSRLLAFANEEVPVSSWPNGASGPEPRSPPEWRAEEHEVERWCRLLSESGIPADRGRLELPRPRAAAPAWAHGATLLHPGAAAPARRWPVERFAAVARAELAHGRVVAVTAGPGEEEPASLLGALVPGARVVPPGPLLALAALVAAAGRVVCGDTGVAHLATALDTPTVVLFGPVSPRLWGPPPDRTRHVALWAGRTGDPHATAPDPGLLRLTVEDVLAALAALDRLKAAA